MKIIPKNDKFLAVYCKAMDDYLPEARLNVIIKRRSYAAEQKKHALLGYETLPHPLEKSAVYSDERLENGHRHGKSDNSQSSVGRADISVDAGMRLLIDPLTSATEHHSTVLPLNDRIYQPVNGIKLQQHDPDESPLKELWASTKVDIVLKHTPAQRLPLVTGLLFSRENETAATRAASKTLRRSLGSVGRIQNRLTILQELDLSEEVALREPSMLANAGLKSISTISSTVLGSSNDSNNANASFTDEQIFLRVHETKRQLRAAWEKDQRVIALRHVIQCVKLLGDAQSNPLFYPTKFIIVCDVLDLFTNLLFERLLDKSELPKRYFLSARDVSEKAKEICRNWLYKITCVRELLPRILLETALLPCMRFLEDAANAADDNRRSDYFYSTFVRLQKMIRGIGHPLIAVWCRCYLTKVACCDALSVPYAHHSEHLRMAVEDFIRSQRYVSIMFEQWAAKDASAPANKAQYFDAYSAALEWILKCMARSDGLRALDHILTICGNNRLLLRAALKAFPPEIIVNYAVVICEKIRDMPLDTPASRAQLVRSLGVALSDAPLTALEALPKRKLLNVAWQIISPLTVINEYSACVRAWCAFVTRLLGRKEIDIILSDCVRHVDEAAALRKQKPDATAAALTNGHFANGSVTTANAAGASLAHRSLSTASLASSSTTTTSSSALLRHSSAASVEKQVQDDLLSICESVLARPAGAKQSSSMAHLRDLCDLLNSPVMLKLLDVLHNGNARCDAARVVADAYCKSLVSITTNKDQSSREDVSCFTTDDPVLINTLQSAMRTRADTLDMLAGEDEQRSTSRMLSVFICSVDYGRDLDSLLAFYVQCRESFYRFDDILALLIQLVLSLAMRARALRLAKVGFNDDKNAAAAAVAHYTNSSKRTAAFVHSCCAYAFITIPSAASSATMQYKLYMHLAQVCLANMCIGQAEASLRAAVQLLYTESNAILSEVHCDVAVPAVGKIDDANSYAAGKPVGYDAATTNIDLKANMAVAKLVAGMFSVLLIVPDRFVAAVAANDIDNKKNEDAAPVMSIDALYWYRGLMNACDVFCDSIKHFIRVDAVAYLCAAAQAQYCLHVAGIDSNDTLTSVRKSPTKTSNHNNVFTTAVQETLDENVTSIVCFIIDSCCAVDADMNKLQNHSTAALGFAVLDALLNVLISHTEEVSVQHIVTHLHRQLLLSRDHNKQQAKNPSVRRLAVLYNGFCASVL